MASSELVGVMVMLLGMTFVNTVIIVVLIYTVVKSSNELSETCKSLQNWLVRTYRKDQRL